MTKGKLVKALVLCSAVIVVLVIAYCGNDYDPPWVQRPAESVTDRNLRGKERPQHGGTCKGKADEESDPEHC